MPSSLRIELNKAKYDWDRGQILHEAARSQPRHIQNDDPILDKTFSNGTGTVDMPKIFAKDKKAVYFATFSPIHGSKVSRVAIDIEAYTQQRAQIPYPGD